jgi:hypothetical protein
LVDRLDANGRGVYKKAGVLDHLLSEGPDGADITEDQVGRKCVCDGRPELDLRDRGDVARLGVGRPSWALIAGEPTEKSLAVGCEEWVDLSGCLCTGVCRAGKGRALTVVIGLITPIPNPVLSTRAAQCSVAVIAPGIHAPPGAPGPRNPVVNSVRLPPVNGAVPVYLKSVVGEGVKQA